MRNLLYFFAFAQAFLISAVSMPLLIRLAKHLRVIDRPGHRKVHETSKPLLGGVGIFLGFFATIVIDLVLFWLLQHESWVRTHLQAVVRIAPALQAALGKLVIVLSGALLMHLVGLVDDIFKERVSYKPKFIAQFLIALLVVLGGVRTQFMPGQVLDIIVSTIWIVGVTNGFNLLDNLDGLSSGIAIISGLLLFTIAILQGQVFFAFLLAALIGACLGFLLFNFHPSKLFMGDSGSLFLGYIFAAVTVTGSYVMQNSASLIPVLTPFLILSIPLYDTFSVMYIRWREGRPLFLGDKRHFSHRLLELGMSHRGVVIFIYLVCFCVGSAALLLPYLSVAASLLIVVQVIAMYGLLTILISYGRKNQFMNLESTQKKSI